MKAAALSAAHSDALDARVPLLHSPQANNTGLLDKLVAGYWNKQQELMAKLRAKYEVCDSPKEKTQQRQQADQRALQQGRQPKPGRKQHRQLQGPAVEEG